MIWKSEYKETLDDIHVEGYSVAEADCRAFFSSKVASKIVEADCAEQLRTHLEELETTGFDSSALITEMSKSTVQVKDWEIGEAIAEVVLAEEHDAIFPWETGWDKRTPRASLPGADIVGFQNKTAPRFMFGQVKSSSENRLPPQVVNSGKDCLRNQMHTLKHECAERIQLIQWLLVRAKGSAWENSFNEALERYVQEDYYLVGILISGGRAANAKDLTGICKGINHTKDSGEISLFGYYLPFDMKSWVSMVPDWEVTA